MGVRGVRGLWNCVAMEQSGYIREWQNLLLTLSALYGCLRSTNIYNNFFRTVYTFFRIVHTLYIE